MDSEQGKVSVWINKVPVSAYPESYLEENYDGEDDAPLCEWAGNFGFDYYDSDFMDVALEEGKPRPIRMLMTGCSYVESFLSELEAAAVKLGQPTANHAILLYDFDYSAMKEKVAEDSYMRFVGTFKYVADD